MVKIFSIVNIVVSNVSIVVNVRALLSSIWSETILLRQDKTVSLCDKEKYFHCHIFAHLDI